MKEIADNNSMNSGIRLIFCLTIFSALRLSAPLWAAGAEAAPVKAPENSFNDVVDEKSFSSIIDKNEEAKALYEGCKSNNDFYKCMKDGWDSLSPAVQTEIAKELERVSVTLDKDGKQVFKKEKIDTIKLNPASAAITSSNDPSMVALRKFLSDQLSNALYGELNQKSDAMTKRKLVDHKAFYDLFETQVGQNIILALSDYCMNAVNRGLPGKNAGSIYLIEEAEQEKNFKNNFDQIKTSYGDSSKFEGLKDSYNSCIRSIATVCNKVGLEYTKGGSGDLEKVSDFSKNRACLVNEYLDRAREALINIDKIKEAIPERGEAGSFIAENEVYRSGKGKGEKSLQQLAIHTSSDIQKSGMSEAATKSAEAVQECLDSNDEETCAKYVDSGLEDKQKIFAEEFLRIKAQRTRLEEDLGTDDEEKALKYLAEEGYDEASAQAVIDELGVDEAVKKIKARYDAQKDAVIAALQAEIDKSSVAENADASTKQGKITKVQSDIQTKPEKLAKLLYYSNLASSFITIESKNSDPNNKSFAVNTVAAFSELENAGDLVGSNRSPSDTGGLAPIFDNQDQLDKSLERLNELKENNAQTGKDLDSAAKSDITVDEINSNLLKYTK